MRKAVLIPIVAVLGVLLVLAGCAGAGGRTTFPLGQPVTLAPGQSAEITGEDLRITFIGDVTDSRCPAGATWVWAGQVSVTVEVTRTGSNPSTPVKLVLTAGAQFGNEPTQVFDGHQIKFSVSPYPQLGKTIPAGDYRLTMTVTRAEEGGRS